MGLLFVKAVIPQLWKPLLITCQYLFISLKCQKETALRKAEKVLPRDEIIHKDVENVLIPCASRVFMASIRARPLPDISA